MSRKKYETEEERKAAWNKYQREYHARRMKEDPEFAERQRAAMRRYDRRTRGARTKLYKQGRPKKYKTYKEQLQAKKDCYARAYAKFLHRYKTDPEFKEKHRARCQEWYKKNRPAVYDRYKKYISTNREHYNARARERYATDPEYRAKRVKYSQDSAARRKAKNG